MAKDYNELAAFMRMHKSNPLALAKVMTAWAWGSLLPGGKTEPATLYEVPELLSARCGWRDALMEALFEEIGIQHRRVNFYDVPFQTNHTATELFINGKWMFFDASFGTYLVKEGSSTPLSMEEARNAWPNVKVMQCTLPGMQNTFLSPEKISPKAFAAKDDSFFYVPTSYTYMNNDYTISGQLHTLYFGYKAKYVDNDGIESSILSTARKWNVKVDRLDTKDWIKIVDYFNQNGKRDATYILYDNKVKKFIEYDLVKKADWSKQITHADSNNGLLRKETLFDDKSKVILDNDPRQIHPWTSITTAYAQNSKLEYKLIKYDSKSNYIFISDAYSIYSWSSYEDRYSSAGTSITTIRYDDGSTATYDWNTAFRTIGDQNSNELNGTNGDDVLVGLAGNDVLNGGAGIDRLEGGAGNDTYYVETTEDFVVERPNEGIDTVYSLTNHVLGVNVENLVLGGDATYGSGNAGNNRIIGNDYRNALSGLNGADYLKGYGGNDSLDGGVGKDTLESGAGHDRLQGGSGADVFLWNSLAEVGLSKSAADLILDFSKAENDIINLRPIDANETLSGNQAFVFVGSRGFTAPGQIRFVQSEGETFIYFNTDKDLAADAVLRLAGKLSPEASWFVL